MVSVNCRDAQHWTLVSALRWSQLKCTTGTVLADGNTDGPWENMGDILESAEATISPKLNPGLNSNLPDANIGPQMLCPLLSSPGCF